MNSSSAVDTGESRDKVLQWVTFNLGEETYGVNVMQVREVLRYSEIARCRARHLTCWGSSTCAVTW